MANRRNKPDLSQTHDPGHWEDQRRERRTFPFWNTHPLRKPVAWCVSSLRKETTVCSLIPGGPLKNCPSGPPFYLVFSPSIKLLPWSYIYDFSWSPLLGMLLWLPSPVSLLKVLPPVSQDQGAQMILCG